MQYFYKFTHSDNIKYKGYTKRTEITLTRHQSNPFKAHEVERLLVLPTFVWLHTYIESYFL
jgi:hypothetical protein